MKSLVFPRDLNGPKIQRDRRCCLSLHRHLRTWRTVRQAYRFYYRRFLMQYDTPTNKCLLTSPIYSSSYILRGVVTLDVKSTFFIPRCTTCPLDTSVFVQISPLAASLTLKRCSL